MDGCSFDHSMLDRDHKIQLSTNSSFNTELHVYIIVHNVVSTIGLVMMAPSSVKREEKPRGVHTDIRSTPSIETTE